MLFQDFLGTDMNILYMHACNMHEDDMQHASVHHMQHDMHHVPYLHMYA